MKRIHIAAIVVASLCLSALSSGAATDAEKCEASKNKTAGSYFACLQKAEAKSILKMTAPDYTKCSEKFDDKYDKAETSGNMMCPDDVLTTPMNTYLAGLASDTAAILAGGPIPGCGDDLVNAVGEQCDGADLGGLTCASFGHAYGTLQCSGLCELDTSACSNCPGGYYLGECYVLGAVGADCNATCAAYSMAYDTATLTEAGSFGTDADCESALDAAGAPGSGLDFPSASCVAGLGCMYGDGDRIRCSTPITDPGSVSPTAQRLCACH